MTTAARPTFETARGGKGKGEAGDLSAMSKHYSSRDLPSHTRLKYRQEGQSNAADLLFRDFRKDLDERERSARERKDKDRTKDAITVGSSGGLSSSKRLRLDQVHTLDADDPADDDDEDEESDDDADDAAELLAELQKIKKERAAEQAKREAERKAEEERIRTENILKGNPLINSEKGDFKVKRRWDDDVVFKNCARPDEKSEKGFINDLLRSEFHKRFMTKYIK